MGSTCFMNSILQAMLKNPVILDILNCNIDEGYYNMCTKPILLSSNDQDAKRVGVGSGLGASGYGNSSSGSSSSSSSSVSNSNSSGNLLLNGADGSSTALALALTSKTKRFTGCIACEIKDLAFPGYMGKSLGKSSNNSIFSLSSGVSPQSKTTQTLVPSSLLYSIWLDNRYLSGYDQQDAHEFLVALRDSFDTHWTKYHIAAHGHGSISNGTNSGGGGVIANGGVGGVSSDYVRNATTEMDIAAANGTTNNATPSQAPISAFSQAFSGILRSEIHCLRCGFVSSKDELFYDISLSMVEVLATHSTGTGTGMYGPGGGTVSKVGQLHKSSNSSDGDLKRYNS